MRQNPAAPECANSRRDPELGEVHRPQHDQQRQQRQRDHAVGDAHQHRVRPPAEVARGDPDQQADARARRRRQHPHQQRHLPAHHQPRQLVAPGVVRAQPVRGRGRVEARQQVGGVGVDAQVPLERPRAEHEHHQHRQQHQARHRQAVAAEAPPAQPPAGSPPRRSRGRHGCGSVGTALHGCSCAAARKEALLFLKKKKQKNFAPVGPRLWARSVFPRRHRSHPWNSRKQKFFASFFQKRSALPSFLIAARSSGRASHRPGPPRGCSPASPRSRTAARSAPG